MMQQQQAMQQYKQDTVNTQAGEQQIIRQCEQEAAQLLAEVLQRLHMLEQAVQKQVENTKICETTGTGQQRESLAKEEQVAFTINATKASVTEAGMCRP